MILQFGSHTTGNSYPRCYRRRSVGNNCIATVVLYVILHLVRRVGAFSIDMTSRSVSKSITTTYTENIEIMSIRRKSFLSIISRQLMFIGIPIKEVVADDGGDMLPGSTMDYQLENRDRKGNQDAVIRDDYWYVTGKLPPRLLTTQLKGDDPQWNAFGSCTTSESTGTNSCTYVSINQRRAAYTKYASSISYGAVEYTKLGEILQSIKKSKLSSSVRQLWQDAAVLVKPDEPLLPATVDAELKMVLMATALLTSPNFPGPSRELLVARFYANEVRFAHRALYRSIKEQDIQLACHAYEFGRDSWNSYFQTIARSIVPKVGDPFAPIPIR